MRRLCVLLVLVAVVLAAPVALVAQEKPTSPPPARTSEPPMPAVQGFYLVLLVADNKPGPAGGGVEGLTAGATKALKDAREFLPFKSYRIQDSVLIRSVDRATARVEGPDGAQYSANIRTAFNNAQRSAGLAAAGLRPNATPEMSVSFDLLGTYVNSNGEQKTTTVISTSFSMEVGETVVVGTSKVRGTDQALVVLLSALPGK
jgi:hypothetical protein